MVKRREYPKRGSKYSKNPSASFTPEERKLIAQDKQDSGYYAKNPSLQHYRRRDDGRRDDGGELSYEQQVNQRAMQIVQESIQAAEGEQGGMRSDPTMGMMTGPSATSAWLKDRQMNAPKAPASRPISPPQKKNQKKKPPRMTRQQQDKWLKESKRGKNSYGDKR